MGLWSLFLRYRRRRYAKITDLKKIIETARAATQ